MRSSCSRHLHLATLSHIHAAAIISSAMGIEYYVGITSFVDKEQIEPGSTVLLHHKVMSVIGLLNDDTSASVQVRATPFNPDSHYLSLCFTRSLISLFISLFFSSQDTPHTEPPNPLFISFPASHLHFV